MISHICIREIVKTLLPHLITAVSQSSLLIILNSELQHAIWHVYFRSYMHSVCAQYVSEQSTVVFSRTCRSCDNKRWMYCGWVQWLERVRLQSRNITDGPPGSIQVLTLDSSVLVMVQYILMVCSSCRVMLVCVCASEFLNSTHR